MPDSKQSPGESVVATAMDDRQPVQPKPTLAGIPPGPVFTHRSGQPEAVIRTGGKRMLEGRSEAVGVVRQQEEKAVGTRAHPLLVRGLHRGQEIIEELVANRIYLRGFGQAFEAIGSHRFQAATGPRPPISVHRGLTLVARCAACLL
jgi:hypothetical protein